MFTIGDTGSQKLWIETDLCTNCDTTQVFETASSSTYVPTDPLESTTTTYGSGKQLTGHKAYETVCINTDTSSCATSFPFFAITTQSGFTDTFNDAIMGMWAGNLDSQTNLFVPHLYNQGVINENSFSFYLNYEADTSFIDFGAPDPTIVGDGTNVVWLDAAADEYWWTNQITGMYYGDDPSNKFYV
jgi:hypothetical protein